MVVQRDVDGGWAWCILAASYFNLLLCSGLLITAGVFQIVLLEEFQGSVALTSWITALFSGFMQIGGPLSSFMSNRYGCRETVMLGGALMSLGFVISSMANSLVLLFISLGIVAGIGIGLIYTTSIVVTSYFFEKRRTMANGIVLSGSGLGIFVLPQVARFLYSYFTWRETFVIMGAVAAQICVSGSLMFSIHENPRGCQGTVLQKLFPGGLCRKQQKDIVDSNAEFDFDHVTNCQVIVTNEEECEPLNVKDVSYFKMDSINSIHIHDITERENKNELNGGRLENTPFTSQLSSSHQQIVHNPLLERHTKKSDTSRSLQELTILTNTNNSNSSLLIPRKQDSGDLGRGSLKCSLSKLSKPAFGSHMILVSRNPSLVSGIASTHHLDAIILDDLADVDSLKSKSFLEQNIVIKTAKSEASFLADEIGSRGVRTNSHYTPLYKNWPFLLLNLGLFINNAGCGLFNIHVPSFYETIGMSEQEMTNCLSIHGLMTLLGRILSGALANSANDSTLVIYIMMNILGGVIICLIPPLGTGYIANIVLTCFTALFAISHCALLPTLTIHFVGLHNLATAFGIEMVSAGLGYLVAPPLAGNIVDLTGSYDYSLYLSGILFMIGGLVTFVVPCVDKTDNASSSGVQ